MKKILILLCSIICALSCIGCTKTDTTQVQQVVYDPYNFTPAQFVEEGGWETASEAIFQNLPQMFCELNEIVVDGGVYESNLFISGVNYKFDEAVLGGAVFTHNNPNNTDKESQIYNNWLDVAYTIPTEGANLHAPASIVIRASNITRTQDGEYTCLSIKGIKSTSGYLQLRKDIDLQSYFVINDDVIKTEVDYGLLAYNSEAFGYSALADYVFDLEDKRLTAYLTAHEKKDSLYFSTVEYQSYPASVYTTDFNAESVISDLKAFTSTFGMESVNITELPEKKRQLKKTGWQIFKTSYLITDNAQMVQEYFRSCIRDQYFVNENTRFSFNAVLNEKGDAVSLLIYYNTTPKTEKE